MSLDESSGLYKDLSLGNCDGIHWNSFITALMPRSILTQESLQEAFNALDVDSVGYLTEDSFKHVLAGDADALAGDDSIAALFKGLERVDFKAFSEAFFKDSSAATTPVSTGSGLLGGALPPALPVGSIGGGEGGAGAGGGSSGPGPGPGPGGAGGGGGGGASGIAIAAGNRTRGTSTASLSSLFIMGLASPARDTLATSTRSLRLASSVAVGGESFPIGLPSALGPARTPLTSFSTAGAQAAAARVEGFQPVGIGVAGGASVVADSTK